MPGWKEFIDLPALVSLLPGEYARFARPVRDCLVAFLDGLSAARQLEILRQQAALPASATLAQRLGLLARSCPVLQKLGQVLARDPRLSPDLRTHLRALESLAPTVPLEAIRNTLTRELGSVEQLGLELVPPALARARVAVVIPFRVIDAPALGLARRGVVNLLKPRVKVRLDEEFALLETVRMFLDDRRDEPRIPHLHDRDAFSLVRQSLRIEPCMPARETQSRRDKCWSNLCSMTRLCLKTRCIVCVPGVERSEPPAKRPSAGRFAATTTTQGLNYQTKPRYRGEKPRR